VQNGMRTLNEGRAVRFQLPALEVGIGRWKIFSADVVVGTTIAVSKIKHSQKRVLNK
jgi:hypothetical protein